MVFALEPVLWRRMVSDPASACAVLCVVSSAAVAIAFGRFARRRAAAAAALLIVAVTLTPTGAVLTALKLMAVLLLAQTISRLPVGAPSRASLAALLVVILAADRVTTWRSDDWRLFAWADAVQHTLPRGATIYTSQREIAARQGQLFRGRPAQIRLGHRDRLSEDVAPQYVLEDFAPALDGRATQPVPLRLSLDHFIAHAPADTVIGLAVAAVVAPATGPSTWMGVARDWGVRFAKARPQLQVLLGDVLTAEGQRAPIDADLAATQNAVAIRLRGRDVIAGAAWGVVLLEPDGSMIGAFAGDELALTVPIQLDGWRIRRIPAANP